jgi:hypothetical protein
MTDLQGCFCTAPIGPSPSPGGGSGGDPSPSPGGGGGGDPSSSSSSIGPIVGGVFAFLIVLAAVLYYTKRAGPANDKTESLLDNDSLREMAMLAETQTKPKAWKVFVSWRMAESKAEVTELTKALEARGVEVVVIRELAGGNLLKAVSQGMTKADMFVIMGTHTYGTTTSGLIDTNKEMQHIITSKKPYLLLNMNPESSCLEFKEPDANLVLNLEKEPRTWERWEVGQPMDDALPDKIAEMLSKI